MLFSYLRFLFCTALVQPMHDLSIEHVTFCWCSHTCILHCTTLYITLHYTTLIFRKKKNFKNLYLTTFTFLSSIINRLYRITNHFFSLQIFIYHTFLLSHTLLIHGMLSLFSFRQEDISFHQEGVVATSALNISETGLDFGMAF